MAKKKVIEVVLPEPEDEVHPLERAMRDAYPGRFEHYVLDTEGWLECRYCPYRTNHPTTAALHVEVRHGEYLTPQLGTTGPSPKADGNTSGGEGGADLLKEDGGA